MYFDEESNKNLQRYINMVAKSTGNTFMTYNNVPPHLTITAVEARSVDVLVPAFKGLEGRILGGKVTFTSIGQILPNVMYVTPVFNKCLMDTQNEVYKAFVDIPETTISKYYKPFSWLPHVTIAKQLNKEQMAKAFEVMRDVFVPFEASIEKIGLSKVNPHVDVEEFRLYFP